MIVMMGSKLEREIMALCPSVVAFALHASLIIKLYIVNNYLTPKKESTSKNASRTDALL